MNFKKLVLLLCFTLSVKYVYCKIDYEPKGTEQTIALEKAFIDIQPGYVDGIYPKQDILNMGVSKSEIHSYWIQKIETWLRRVLQPDYSPGSETEIAMYGLPEFRWKSDYIVGHYVTVSKKNGESSQRVEFQATDRYLPITIFLKEKVQDVNVLSDDAILQIVQKYIAIPTEKLSKISIEKTCNVLAGIPICYGKMRCGYHEVKDAGKEKEKGRRWWSYIPFWITEDKLFVAVSTIDWEKDDRPAAANSRLFKIEGRKGLKYPPANNKKK
jgi:hypothetical protein